MKTKTQHFFISLFLVMSFLLATFFSCNLLSSQKAFALEDKSPYVDKMSVRIQGDWYPITPSYSSVRLDEALKEWLLWSASGISNKTTTDNISVLLAAHNVPYGALIFNASEVLFQDKEGHQKVYSFNHQSDVMSWDAKGGAMSSWEIELSNGRSGDVLAFQTCVSSNGDYVIRFYTPKSSLESTSNSSFETASSSSIEGSQKEIKNERNQKPIQIETMFSWQEHNSQIRYQGDAPASTIIAIEPIF